MLEGRFHKYSLLLPVSLILATVACSSLIDEYPSGNCPKEMVPVQLAVNLNASLPTKADIQEITELASGDNFHFRGMSGIRVIPFDVNDDPVGNMLFLPAISSAQDESATGSHTGLIKNNLSHLFSSADAELPVGCASVVAYGIAAESDAYSTEFERKHLNGSLQESGLTMDAGTPALDGISFAPEPIYDASSGTPSQASLITNILTDIVIQGGQYEQNFVYVNKGGESKTGSRTFIWNDAIGDSRLQEYFDWITNGGQLMSATGVNVEYMITTLYRTLSNYESYDTRVVTIQVGNDVYEVQKTSNIDDDLTFGDVFNSLAAHIKERIDYLIDNTSSLKRVADGTSTAIEFVNEGLHTYPDALGLPHGAAVMRWTSAGFVPVFEGLDGVASLSQYCYPPSLYYYTESPVSITEDGNVETHYTSGTSTWAGILSNYDDGHTVTRQTKSVAVDNSFRYAVGMLYGTLRASQEYLPDNDGSAATNVRVYGSRFPVTGIIIGGQYPQRYNFTPVTYASDEEYQDNELFLYDNKVSGVYLTRVESAPFFTLALQTPPQRDVYFALELQNDSGASFYGAEGRILPGHRFYLTGKLEFPTGAAFDNIFLKYHCTTVSCLVNSLEAAHNAVPDLGVPQLSVGVQTQVNWIFSTGATVVLY